MKSWLAYITVYSITITTAVTSARD